MPPDVAREEGTLGDDGEVVRLGVFEGGVRQGARDAVPFDRCGHFGVGENDRLPIALVFGECEILANVRLESLCGRVLLDGHGIVLLVHHRFLSCVAVAGGARNSMGMNRQGR